MIFCWTKPTAPKAGTRNDGRLLLAYIVWHILSSIFVGLDIQIQSKHKPFTIICAGPHIPLAQYWRECQEPSVKATAIPGFQYVCLCQQLFSLQRHPDTTYCTGSLGTNGHISTGQRLARTQLTILLHELVGIYLASTPDFTPLNPKVFGLDAVLNLTAAQSVANDSDGGTTFLVAALLAAFGARFFGVALLIGGKTASGRKRSESSNLVL